MPALIPVPGMFLRIGTVVLGLAGTAGLLGCATGIERFGTPIPFERVAQIEPGRSTRAEILTLFGPPTASSLYLPDKALPEEAGNAPLAAVRAGEEVLLWEYQERHERFGTALLYTYFSHRTLTDTLLVVLDANGVVSHAAFGLQTGGGD